MASDTKAVHLRVQGAPMSTREMVLDALDRWIRQRPGLEFANYGDMTSYRAEVRSIARDKRDAEILLKAVYKLGDRITYENLMDGFRAFSGRLSWVESKKKPGYWGLDYVTGQYWPTEYRRAAAAVLASVLWNFKRAEMPKPFTPPLATGDWYPWRGSDGLIHPVSAGDYLRRSFRAEFGARLQKRWFD